MEQNWKIYIQEQQPNQFQCYTQNMDFVNRMDQYVAIAIRMNKWLLFKDVWVLYRSKYPIIYFLRWRKTLPGEHRRIQNHLKYLKESVFA